MANIKDLPPEPFRELANKNPHEDSFVRNPFKKQNRKEAHAAAVAEERRQRGLLTDTHEDLKKQADDDLKEARRLEKEKYDAYYLRIEKWKFLTTFVLSQANTCTTSLDGERAAEEAAEAWNAIERFTTPPK